MLQKNLSSWEKTILKTRSDSIVTPVNITMCAYLTGSRWIDLRTSANIAQKSTTMTRSHDKYADIETLLLAGKEIWRNLVKDAPEQTPRPFFFDNANSPSSFLTWPRWYTSDVDAWRHWCHFRVALQCRGIRGNVGLQTTRTDDPA